jgi:hypothetical protein
MEEKLVKYYSLVEEKEGYSGKIELTKKTNLPRTKASTAPDSTESIQMFRDAVEDILGEEPPRL